MGKDAPVGVFDSGLGGLTVVREIIRQLPEQQIVYFGDTARVPYGSKSQSTVIHYTNQILRFLYTREVKAIVVACNTASAYALEEVRDSVPMPIIGVVKPGARVAAHATVNGRIGVIGTEATVQSGLYTRYIQELSPGAQVFSKACPLFVPLVEEGMWKDSVTTEIASRYLSVLKEAEIDTLILGCTHYPLIRSTIREVMGERVNLVNPAYETAVELRRTLERYDLMPDRSHPAEIGEHSFFVSDDPEHFRRFASDVLKTEIRLPEKIAIEEY